MLPAGYYEENLAAELAVEFVVSIHICRLVVLLETEEERNMRAERILLLDQLVRGIDVLLNREQIDFLHKVCGLLLLFVGLDDNQ